MMSKIDENKIRRHLELLSRIEPTSEATHRAIERVRDTLTSEKKKQARIYIEVCSRIFKGPLIKFAAAAVLLICAGFLAGRWSKPARSEPHYLDVTGYTTLISVYPTSPKAEDSFWRQKAIAAMQPRPYAQTSTTKTNLLNAYKQYIKEKHYD